MESEGEFHTKPMCILDRKEVVFQKRTIVQVKVQWKHYTPHKVTLEEEDVMRQVYPILFQDYDKTV